jgi:hypothetical protein
MNDIDEVRGKYKLGGLHHRIIAALSKHDMGAMEIKAVIKATLPSHDFRAELKRLSREKLVLDTGNDTWSITPAGLNASVLLGAVPVIAKRSRKAMSERVCNANSAEDYVPTELGFTCPRQGAYDAFLLPSRMGNTLHYPNGRVVEV